MIKATFVTPATAATSPADTLENVKNTTVEAASVIREIGSAVTADPTTGKVFLSGAEFSVYENMEPADKKRADQLADATKVRDDNGETIAMFGITEQEKMSQLVDRLLDKASQFTLDRALNATTDELTKIVDSGLDLSLIYDEDPNWIQRWIEQNAPFLAKLSRFLQRVDSIRHRLETIRTRLKSQDATIIEDVGAYGVMSEQYAQTIDRFYIYTAACERIFLREVEYQNQLIEEAKAHPKDARYTVAVTRQQTVVRTVMTRMFYMLSQAVNSFLKVNVIEEGRSGAIMAHQSVIEAVYGAIDDLKQSIAMILMAYRTAQTHQRALQVSHAALEALNKVVEQGKLSNAMLATMSDEQKAAIGTYLAVKDTLVNNITRAKEILEGMKQNYRDLYTASNAVTKSINDALAA